MDLNFTLHKNRPVCFYLVVRPDIFLYASGCVSPGDALVPTSRVVRVRRASRTG